MKTAIQELRDDILIEIKLGYISEHSALRIFNYIDALYLEKEKEQIINANRSGVDMVVNKEKFITGEDYYNQTFNQKEDKTFKQKSKWTSVDNTKQHIVDIMKADKDDGLYKMFDTDSDKKH